jgi:flavin reductase (DIM6/NTAB) family NADH-FMN oxidoreductase RutF
VTRIDVAGLDPRRAYRLLIDSVVPRPVAWVSTLDVHGRPNLAPFSFFQAVGSTPPTVIVSVGRHDDDALKDTATNILATGELVINIADETLAAALVATSGAYPPGADEFVIAGVTPAASQHVKPPRVQEAPISLECRLLQSVPLGHAPDDYLLIIAEVIAYQIRDGLYRDGRIDPDELRPLCRLGGNGYARLGDVFRLDRPAISRQRTG